jgi:hypothetical protein
MIYEVRTYDVKPGSTPEVIKRIGDAYEVRRKFSELVGFFYTEIGPLNQVVHIWPYESLDERARIRAAASKAPGWPPKVHEFLVRMQSEIFVPFPFSPPLKPATLGPIYEMRSYFVKADGGLDATKKRWEPKLPERTKLSPLVVVMNTELGPLNKFVHIWAYKSLEERAQIRKKAVETGAWPPPGGAESLVSMENKILLPAPFSPLQ